MSAALTLDLGLDRVEAPRRPAREPLPPGRWRRDRPSLDEVVTAAWKGVRAGRAVDCPACGGVMRAAAPARGRCGDCGTTLS